MLSLRQFLSASHPSDKYKVSTTTKPHKLTSPLNPQFFLRGTQLSQLSDEYDTCLENITQTSKVLAQKKEAIPDLRAAHKEASARFEEASKAREQKHKAETLKKELAWAHVAAKEEELTGRIQEVAKIRKGRLPKLEKEIVTAQVRFFSTCCVTSPLVVYFEVESLTRSLYRNNSSWRQTKSRNTRLSISSWVISII
jgi:hypothetical protein